ncbi:MAG TPA: hypothetical protein VFC39_18800 [Acidobacteriaceae bacterium]|nr:hypothetical protein [Acidobacteriaceae bacterium]
MQSSQWNKPGFSPPAIFAQKHDREHMGHYDAWIKQPHIGSSEKNDEGYQYCRESGEKAGPDHSILPMRYGAVGKNETDGGENFERSEMPLAKAQDKRAYRAP